MRRYALVSMREDHPTRAGSLPDMLPDHLLPVLDTVAPWENVLNEQPTSRGYIEVMGCEHAQLEEQRSVQLTIVQELALIRIVLDDFEAKVVLRIQ